MDTRMHTVDLRYEHEELLALFDTASKEDVDEGGRYDRRGGAINVWSHHWGNEATKHDSETVGTFYVHWADQNCIYQVECDEGFELDDLLHELALLEEKALGYVKHGKRH